MINDLTKFNEMVEKYCAELPGRWKGEKYKWQAAKRFQDNFDINAADLADNLDKSISNKMMNARVSPRGMLIRLARYDQNTIKQALIDLFDESQPLITRLKSFLNVCNIVKNDSNVNNGTSFKSSGQNYNTTFELLSLRYPDKYYGYREWIFININEFFNMGYTAKRSNKNRIVDSENAHEEIRVKLLQNPNFIEVTSNQIESTCYEDEQKIIATSDFCFWIADIVKKAKPAANIANSDENDDEEVEEIDDLETLHESTTETSTFEVYYGIPGCGKSYSLNERLATDGYDEIVRTVFYPEYSNADFVGQLMPQKHGGNMDFVVKPGPFARALALAFSKPNKKVALVIEEINRGNASAIFGEIFQLLDVVNNQNRSQYSIFSPVLTEYLKEKCQIDLEEVYIPGNLSIFGTMNTSDQNVFKFDTAFKRRWKMHRLTNDNGGFDSAQHDFDVPNLNIKWSEFVKKINDAILKNDLEEDRQLGLWFYQEDKNDKDLAKSFGEKVLEYLWNDVTKYNHEILFNKDIKSFDELLKMYFDTAKSKEIFNEEILK